MKKIDQQTRIACVGDSITYGAHVWNRRINCYPAKLQKLLGEKYLVRNFGVNSGTMQKVSDKPYWEQTNFKKSTDFLPNIVILMLGTNDSKRHNWRGASLFKSDYRDMLRHYQSLTSAPKLYLMTPPTAYIVKRNKDLNFNMTLDVMEEITCLIKEIAKAEHLPCIDLHAATAGHPEYFPLDGIHTNTAGAQAIANFVYDALK